MTTKKKSETKLPAGFNSVTVDWNNTQVEKILGPGHNPEEIKFEGNPEGTHFVHVRAGMPQETICDHAEPAENWFVRFGGTEEECQAFCTR